MFDKHFVGLDLTGVRNNGEQRPVSRVTLLVDDENAVTAGDDTGIELTSSCPYATQAMADRILAGVKGYQYRMFAADDARLDPAAELGDGITAGDIYSVLSRISEDGSGFPSVTAPGKEELEDEYPAGGLMTQEFNRKIAQTRSQILKTAESIILQVEAVDGRVAAIRTFVDNITLSVANGSTSSTITIKSGNIDIASQTISMSGLVTYTGLADGTTTINGGCIQTGLISANRLDLTGAITFSDLSRSVQNDINDAYAMAEDAQALAGDLDDTVSAWTYGGTTYIDGSKLMTGTVMASQLLGGYVGLLDSREREVGGISIAYTSTGYGIELSSDTGGIRINPSGNFWVDANHGVFGITESGVVCGADCVPYSSGRYSLGAGGLYWTDIYAENDVINTSDRNRKKNIQYGLDRYSALFDRLRPVSYQLADGRSGRTHLGLIAQDVEDALAELGISTKEFAGFVKSPRADGGYDYALRYGELIAMLIYEVQKLKKE